MEIFLGLKRPGSGVNTPSRAEVKEMIEVCLYSPLGLHKLFPYLYLYQAQLLRQIGHESTEQCKLLFQLSLCSS